MDPGVPFQSAATRGPARRVSVADLSRLHEHPEINLVSNTVEPDGVTGTGGTGVCANESDPLQARYPFRQDLEYAKLSAERRSGGPEWRGYAVQTKFGF